MSENKTPYNPFEEIQTDLLYIRSVVDKLSSTQSPPTEKAKVKLTLEEVRLIIPGNPTRQYLYNLISQGRIPAHKLPGSNRLFFIRDEIEAWIMSESASNQTTNTATSTGENQPQKTTARPQRKRILPPVKTRRYAKP